MRRHGIAAQGADRRWNNRTRDIDVDYRVKVTRNGTAAGTRLREHDRGKPLQFEIPFYFVRNALARRVRTTDDYPPRLGLPDFYHRAKGHSIMIHATTSQLSLHLVSFQSFAV